MPVVTISREIGTGAADVAQHVAQALGAELVDRRVIDEVARRLQITPEQAEKLDETPSTLLERLFRSLAQSGSPEPGSGFAWSPPFPGDPTFDDRGAARSATEQVVVEAARLANVVIVGRGGAYLLKDQPGVLRVRLRAPQPYRVKMLQQTLGIDTHTATERVKRADANANAYVRDAYHADSHDPASYDLVIDVSRFGAAGAAQIITAAARLASA